MKNSLRLALWSAACVWASQCVVADEPAAPQDNGGASQAKAEAERFFRLRDANGDGKLSREEFPPNQGGLFDRIDANRDGAVDLREDIAFRQERARRQIANRQLAQRREVRLPAGMKAWRDVEYARVDGKPQRLDVYGPESSQQPRPLVVWIHGGGWRAGSKRNCPALRLLGQGYVVASVDYRLTDQAIFPAQIQDCQAAIRYLRKHADDYHIDPRRIGVWGSSAGGHLVALLGTASDVKAFATDTAADASSRVQAVCDFFGPTDFLQMDSHAKAGARIRHNADDSPEAKLIGGPVQQNKDKVASANPITHVTPDDPPFLIVHGDEDPLVPIHQSQLLADALRQAKVDVTFHKVPGAGHGFGRRPEVDKLVDDFFAKHLLSAKQPKNPSSP